MTRFENFEVQKLTKNFQFFSLKIVTSLFLHVYFSSLMSLGCLNTIFIEHFVIKKHTNPDFVTQMTKSRNFWGQISVKHFQIKKSQKLLLSCF